MKNICLILVCLTFISVLPSSATKVIVNDNTDRIVYSRSSAQPKQLVSEQVVQTGNSQVQNSQNTQKKNSWIFNKCLKDSYYNHSMYMFVNDMREELIGTTWDFGGKAKYPLTGDEPEFYQQNIEENQTNTVETTYIEDPRYNRASREASDYYILDKVNAPNTLVPSWVPES